MYKNHLLIWTIQNISSFPRILCIEIFILCIEIFCWPAAGPQGQSPGGPARPPAHGLSRAALGRDGPGGVGKRAWDAVKLGV